MDLAEHSRFTNRGDYKSKRIANKLNQMLVFGERGKALRTEKRTNKLNPHMTAGRVLCSWSNILQLLLRPYNYSMA